MKNTLLQESFTNEFGQVINVGDEVIYAATGTGSTSIRKGKFGGIFKGMVRQYRRNEDGSCAKDENGRYIIDQVEAVTSVRIDGVQGRRFKYDYEAKKGEWEEITRTATLPLKRVYKIDSSLSILDGKRF